MIINFELKKDINIFIISLIKNTKDFFFQQINKFDSSVI